MQWRTSVFTSFVSFVLFLGGWTAGISHAAPRGAGVPLAGLVEVRRLPLQRPAVNHQCLAVLVVDDPKGGAWLAWHDSMPTGLSAHVIHLDASLTPDRAVIDLPGRSVHGLLGLKDGAFVAAVGSRRGPEVEGKIAPGPPSPNTIGLRKMTADGRLVFETHVRGGEGYGAECVWALMDGTAPGVSVTSNGRVYGLFYAIGKHFADGGVHQADEFTALDSSGNVLPASRATWNTSHSFWMSSATGRDGHIYGITIADPQPWGLRLGNYTFNPGHPPQTMLWPSAEVAKTVKHAGVAGRPGPMFPLKHGFGIAVATPLDPSRPDATVEHLRLPMLLLFDERGSVAAPVYLAKEPTNDLIVSAARYGDDHVAYLGGNGPGDIKGNVFGTFPTRLAILDGKGKLLQGPIEIPVPFTFGSHPATLSNGDVVWAGVADDWTTVDDPLTLFIARVRWPGAKSAASAAAPNERRRPTRQPAKPTAETNQKPASEAHPPPLERSSAESP